ncbi:unnamed protein product [Rhizoctonia solani]|uniref:Protein kinase domain-containing protein n=1 Tax=Rhizoctonia solani TaxID=456999 RepID=A0A8H3E4U3_9AGAM|nr:unnamed protein product [Rhizoctonia solani]
MIVHEGHTARVQSVAFSPDGKSVVSGSLDNTVRMWNAHRSSPIGEPLRGHSRNVYSVSYSPLGNLIASASEDKTIRLWDTNTGQQSGDALNGDDGFCSVAFSPDAKLIASGSAGRTVQLWNVQTREAVSAPFKGHTHCVRLVSFSPDGARVVSGSWDKTIRIWDVERGATIIGPLEGHTRAVHSTAFSPDGAQVLSCSKDGTIRFWDARSGGMVGEPYTGHSGGVNSVVFSPCGTYVASGGDDTRVRLWDTRTGRQVDKPFEEHNGLVISVAYSPCGQYIASGSEDFRIIVRNLLAEDLDSGEDGGSHISTGQMSTQEMFKCLRHAGCVDLCTQMDTKQETATIVSGGGFGDLWQGRLDNGTKVAIKAWRNNPLEQCNQKTLQRAARELFDLFRMDSPNIHRLQGVIMFRDQYLGMVSEWMDNGNIREYLLKHPDADRYQLCAQVASGLEYMHNRSTVHGDLKAVNILVSADGIAKLSHLESSVLSEVSSLALFANSTTRWAAPEILLEEVQQKTTQTDVYALGMTMLVNM